jgi:branched-chain amino acid transport system substrate-binding protein
MPTMNHAGVYSSVLAYLRAARAVDTPAAGVPSGSAVVARMKATPIQDELFGPTTIRQDGRAVHDMYLFQAYLFQAKAPGESRGRWDYYTLRATIPAEEAFRPMAQGGCPLVR